MRRIKSQDKKTMDFNVANSVRRENKVLALKTVIQYVELKTA